MIQYDTYGTGLTRRQALLGGSAAAVVGLAPSGGSASVGADLHKTVAARVRALTKGEAVTLRLLVSIGSVGNVIPVINAFTAMTGVEIATTEILVEDINTTLTLDAFSKTQNYDVALPATFSLPDLATAQAIMPLSDFARTYEPAGFREDILYGIGDSFDGDVYGFQTDGDAYMMFYNKTMLDDPNEQARYADTYGTPLARPNIWKELDRQMAFFHRPDQGQYGGLLPRAPGFLASEWWIRFHAKGFWPFSPEMDPQIASDAGVGALEDMIRASEALALETATLNLSENWARFAQGDIYCNMGWGGAQKFYNLPTSEMRGKIVFGQTPGGMIEGSLLTTPYFNWGKNYVVVKNTPFPEIGYLFALFASSPKMSTLAVGQVDGYFDPFRPEHYRDAGIKAAYSEDFLKIHRQSLTSAIPDLYVGGQSDYFRVLGDWLNRALTGEATPETAMARITGQWQLITNGIGRLAQAQRWQQLRAKYPANVRRFMRDLT